MVLAGWHPGERAIQAKLNYARAMDIYQGYTLVNDCLPHEHRIFHTKNLAFVPVTTLDGTGRPWGSLLSKLGQPGFITSPDDTTLLMKVDIGDGDPIAENLSCVGEGNKLIAGLGIEFSTRRRNKFAGSINFIQQSGSSMELTLKINQALGNCPKYVNIRTLEPYPEARSRVVHKQLLLEPEQQLPQTLVSFIHSCDTVFLGTSYVSSQLDSEKFPSHLGMNHRGGRPGFVRVRDGRTCVIPDYSGNRMMQSLGNVDATPLASLTFFDFVSGDILYITGNAKNVVGSEAQAIMPRVNIVTTVDITGFVFVANALAVRQKQGSGVERSPYSPPAPFLTEEMDSSNITLEDVSVSLTRIKLHSPSVATFTFTSSKPIAIKAGQHAIIDMTAFSGKGAYQHMAHEGFEASLNDDCMRTWTVSSSHSSPTNIFELTMREKKHGAITGKLFNIARTLSERRPELMDDTTPLGITGGLIGIGGHFTLPPKISKLLLIAGGIGLTPFLSMLNSIVTTGPIEPWDIILIISTREPQLAVELVHTAIGTQPSPNIRLTIHIFTSQTCSSLGLPAMLHAGRLNDSFFQTMEDVQHRTIFVCGPAAFEEVVIEGLESVGIDHTSIARENFTY